MVKTIFTTHVRVIFASTLAAAIHAAAFYGYSDRAPVSAVADKHNPLHLNIRFTVPPATIEQPVSQPARQPEVSDIEPQKPASKITSKPSSKVLKPVKTVVKQNLPIKPKKQQQVPEPKIRKVTKQSAQPVIKKPDNVTQPLIVVEDELAAQKLEDQFINELLRQIETNKFYPKKARRKNIQGTVRVELKLDDNGNIVSLQLFEGHKILRKAAATAIQASAPFKTPPSSLADPRSINFGVHYQFR